MRGTLVEEQHSALIYDPGCTQDPAAWFDDYLPQHANFIEAAKKILALPPTSSGGERNLSAFKHIWTEKRNRLLVGRAGMLVYIYFNQRVINRITKPHCAADFEGFIDFLDSMDPLPGTDDNAASLDEIARTATSGRSDVFQSVFWSLQGSKTAFRVLKLHLNFG